MNCVLVTGGAGFIGSHFIRRVLQFCQHNIQIVNLDLLTYAGNPDNLRSVENHPCYHFVRGDIRNRELVNQLFDTYSFDTVVHFAAESHVDRSITDPGSFLSTNVLGTQVLLDAAKCHWSLYPQDPACCQYRPGTKFLQISTDEVYGSLGTEGRFTEESPLRPNSPYSASKASADLVVQAYHHTYGLPVNITRCSNNYGPYQFPEKLIPLMICRALHNKPLPVYGDGMQIRDWIHVDDHCTGIEAVLKNGRSGQIYNIGANCEKSNLDIILLILKELNKPQSLITHVKDRPGHDRRYAIDHTKITKELGWIPNHMFEEGLQETISWYVSHNSWIEAMKREI